MNRLDRMVEQLKSQIATIANLSILLVLTFIECIKLGSISIGVGIFAISLLVLLNICEIYTSIKAIKE